MRTVPATWIVVCLALVAGTAQAAKTLDIYFVDTEGGQATLLVSPSGQSLLVDAGFSGNGGRDALRIAAAAKAAGVKRIDYLLITHFHPDHVGGIANVLEKLPVVTFLDHGQSVETNNYPEAYAAAFGKAQHNVIAPGDTIPVKGLDVSVVAAGGKIIEQKGAANGNCADSAARATEQSGEDQHSAGVIVQLGKFRFADLGDLTLSRLLPLLCPENRLGKMDVYLSTRHGAEAPQAVWGMAPRVVVMNNGARKGGDPAAWKSLMASPGLEDMWQLHFAVAGAKEANVPDTFIANVDEKCEGVHLKLSASADGSFTVTNPRNKYTKTYPAH